MNLVAFSFFSKVLSK